MNFITKYLFTSILLITIFSCNGDNNDLKIKKNIEVLNFENIEEIELAEKEFEDISNQSLSSIKQSSIKESNNEEQILANLIDYHQKRIDKIFEIRQELNFTSLQSIADEINSLKLISPQEAYDKYVTYQNLLTEFDPVVSTNENISFPNITNSKGVLLLNDVDINNFESNTTGKKTNNLSAKEVSKRTFKRGIVATKQLSSDMKIVIQWSIGRTKHQDDIGTIFRRAFTQYDAFLEVKGRILNVGGVAVPIPNSFVPVQTIFNASPSSGTVFEALDGPLPQLIQLRFPTGTGTYVNNRSGKVRFSPIRHSSSTGIEVHGDFTVIIGDQIHQLSR